MPEPVRHIIAVPHHKRQALSYLHDGAGSGYNMYPCDCPKIPGIYLAAQNPDSTWTFTKVGDVPTLEEAVTFADGARLKPRNATVTMKLESPGVRNPLVQRLMRQIMEHQTKAWEVAFVTQCFGFFIKNSVYPEFCWEEYTLGMAESGASPEWKCGNEGPTTTPGRAEVWETGILNTSMEARAEFFAALKKHRRLFVPIENDPCDCGSPVLIAERHCRACQ